ncbi:MAG: type I DNA topoisomerase [Candidatus Nomurabacteria bacterium]|jgi:DNA topoisomerase-1|nr:type I DNA topoisomerase [Candidatus Nomurabacteria bacterium]
MKNLVIVESPAKAKTIEKYLGKDFKVLSSVGHIRQIPPKDVNAIDVKNGFKTKYEVDPAKKKVVSELKTAAKSASEVWLATDPDREGEAIAWHLSEVLKLNAKKTKRIEYHEITKSAVEEAIAHPRTIDMDLVKAQQARQALDRLVGYELSPVVWRKVPGGKSAGRVQSPALRLIVEREREIDAFKPEEVFKVSALFKHGKDEFKADLNKEFKTESAAKSFLEGLVGALYTIAGIQTSPGTRNPSAPFTTSTLQQEANSKFGYSARTTMNAAQKLYQEGKITYMRTDSTALSKQALGAIGGYIERAFGKNYLKIRQFKTKNANAQEAHEAIRPTDIGVEQAGGSSYDKKIYELIRNRTLASQMTPAELEKTTVTVDISTAKEVFEAKGEVVIFDGFLKVYGGGKESLLPKLASGDKVESQEVVARQNFSKPPARYTEGSLVKKLESLGIGRPSTYATILENIQTRGYVEKGMGEGKERDVIELRLQASNLQREVVTEKTGADKGKLLPTPAGEVLNDFLVKFFGSIVDYDFTAEIEEELDEVADGKLEHVKMLDAFYQPFHALIEKSGNIERSEVVNARELGTDPKTKKVVLAKLGRFGPMLQLGSAEDDDKPRFAPLPDGATLKDVTLKQALEMFKLPRLVGQTEQGDDIKANIGRFGPYIQVGKLFVSIKPLDPFTITLEESLELYAKKLQAEAEKNIADFGKIKVLNGRYGPYVTDGKKNAKVPKEEDPKSITEERAKELLDKAPAKKKSTTKRRTKKS